MTGNVVNLRLFRKRKDRADRAAEAAGKRAKHGRTRVERSFEEARRDSADRSHDGRRLGAGPDEDDGPAPA